MDMNVDAKLIRNARLRRAWSQEHLAEVCGLGERTIQRIEASGTASFESVKALSAVLEIPLEQLLVIESRNTPIACPVSIQLPPVTGRSRRWRSLAASALASAIAGTGLFLTSNASADQVAMDFKFDMNAETVAQAQLLADDGGEGEIHIGEDLKVLLAPTVNDDGSIFIAVSIFQQQGSDDLHPEGYYARVASPRMLTQDGQAAMMSVKADTGELIELTVTPRVQ